MSYRWNHKAEQPAHADDWLMTYADMITLLLCFFVVFLIVSIAKKDAPPLPPAPPQQALQSGPVVQPPPPPFEINQSFRKLEPQDFTPAAEPPPAPVEEVKEQPQPEAPVVQAEAPPPPPSPPIEQKPLGDRITILEMSSATFFDSGSAALNQSGSGILKELADKLKSDSYTDYQITVEGHTDDSPIHTPAFPSNWELSTARASAVVHFFLEQGIPATRLRAAGYADTFPKAPNRDGNGNAIPTNQAQNRRVVIKLEKIDKAQ